MEWLNNMSTLKVTHLNPANENHLQAVLENLHYGHTIKIINIRDDDNEEYVDYEVS